MDLYPLTFEPIYKPKVWGGRRLEKLGRQLPSDEAIGEAWEIADLSVAAAGEAARSVVRNGPHAGATLHDLMQRFGRELMGSVRPTDTGDFPLLVKYLDARENLSVQVHPNAAYAREHADAHMKSEAWYVVDAEPDAVIYKGFAEPVRPERVREAIRNNWVESLLRPIPVRPGDCHYLPSGTCHALGAGVMVAEVQTPSDTTFRVYDWGRTGRSLHIEEALACMDFGPAETDGNEQRSHVDRGAVQVERLVQCEHFRVERIRMAAGHDQKLPYAEPVVWMILEGSGGLRPPGDLVDPTRFAPGDTLLLPASLEGTRAQLDEDTTLLEITFPV